MMKRCADCNLDYADDKRFCRNCGKPLGTNAVPNPARQARREVVEQRLGNSPTDVELLMELASLLASDGQTSQALVQLHKALEYRPGHVPVMEALASIHSQVGSERESARWWQEVLIVQPDNLRALEGLAELSRHAGALPESIELLSRLARLAPLRLDILEHLLEAHTELKPSRPEDTIAVAKRLLELDPRCPAAWEAIARVEESRGADAPAQEAWKCVLELAPTNPAANLRSGAALLDRPNPGSRVDAASRLRVALQSEKHLNEAEVSLLHLLLATLALEMREPAAECATHLKQVVVRTLSADRSPLFMQCAERLGRRFLEEGDSSAGLNWLSRTVESLPERERYEVLGQCCLQGARSLCAAGRRSSALALCNVAADSEIAPPELLAIRSKLRAMRRRPIYIGIAAVGACVTAAALLVVLSRGRLVVDTAPSVTVRAESPKGLVRWAKAGRSTHEATVEPGDYRVQTSRNGFFDWESTVTVRSARTTRVRPILRNEYASPGGDQSQVEGQSAPHPSHPVHQPAAVQMAEVSRGGAHELAPPPRLPVDVPSEAPPSDPASQNAAQPRLRSGQVESREQAEHDQRSHAGLAAEELSVLAGEWEFLEPIPHNLYGYIRVDQVAPDGRIEGSFNFTRARSAINRQNRMDGTITNNQVVLNRYRPGLIMRWSGTIDVRAGLMQGTCKNLINGSESYAGETWTWRAKKR